MLKLLGPKFDDKWTLCYTIFSFNKTEFIMDLTEIIENNPKARTIILSQNIADIAKKYGITLSDAKKLQCYAAWLEMHSQSETI